MGQAKGGGGVQNGMPAFLRQLLNRTEAPLGCHWPDCKPDKEKGGGGVRIASEKY